MRYIALLRGINVGGKNIIKMSELRAAFHELSFKNVGTYINSGNVFFDSDNTDEAALKYACEGLIADKFNLDIPVCVISASDLHEAIAHAPPWWNNMPDARHDTFFMIPPMTSENFLDRIGQIKEEYEKLSFHKRVVFWSAFMATFNRTRIAKTVTRDKSMYRAITIRNANTTLKLAELTCNQF